MIPLSLSSYCFIYSLDTLIRTHMLKYLRDYGGVSTPS